jgi:cytochrome b6-f complex iron-sulfur subunit
MTSAATSAPAQVQTVPMTRREFLYYIWGASIALFAAETTGLIVWFLIPRFREGEFGGVFPIEVGALPAVDTGPQEFPDGRFWLVNLGDASVADSRMPAGDYPERAQKGVIALYKVCVHLGCLYKWVPTNDRFECPCHGSKYLANGVRIDGPARRNLDVFVIEAVDGGGNVLAATATDNSGSPIELPEGTAVVRVNTGRRVQGATNSAPGGGR